MKLIAQVQLVTSSEQTADLKRTLRRAHAACNWISEQAWKSGAFRRFPLHKLAYYAARKKFPDLSSQVIVRAIAKVADAYRARRENIATFRPTGSFAYDSHMLSWVSDNESVSIWTISGRQRIAFLCGPKQRALLRFNRREALLVFRSGKLYLHVSVEFPVGDARKISDWLGVDLGIVNIATTSDGDNFSGSHLNNLRARASRIRSKLQKKGTKSAKRLLKKRRDRENGFSRHVNHCISKQIVAVSERTGRGIALENLEGINERIWASRKQRRRLRSWAFSDLQSKIAYKALRSGLPVCYVDPRNSSRECHVCGHTEKGNRKTRDLFVCCSCGHSECADVNAARVISSRAPVIAPNVVSVEGVHVDPGAELQNQAN